MEGIVTMLDGPMGGQMEEQMVLLQNMSTEWGRWMQSVDAREVVVEVEGVGTRAAVTSRVLRPRGILRRAQWAENEMPVELVREAVRLRVLMAHPRGGTWTWAALSMKSSEGYKLILTTTASRSSTRPTRRRTAPRNWRSSLVTPVRSPTG